MASPFTIFFLLFFSFPILSTSETTQLITSICRKTPHKQDFCFKTLSANAQAVAAQDARTMVQVACDLGQSYAIETQNFFKNIQEDTTISLELKVSLDTCVAVYDNVISYFEAAAKEERRDVANKQILLISDPIVSCGNSFVKSNLPHVSEILERNELTLSYAWIGLAATDAL